MKLGLGQSVGMCACVNNFWVKGLGLAARCEGEEKGGRVSYKNTCFSPLGGLKRSAIRGRRGSGEGLRRRAGLGRTRGTAATLAAVVFMMALAAFMVWLHFWV